MNAAKAVARINPHIHRFERGIVGFGALNDRDILLALSLITSEGAKLLARVLYAGQPEYLKNLHLCLALEFNCLAGREGWNFPANEIAGVCYTAILEYISPRICQKCQGQENIPDPANPLLIIRCPACEGMGGKAWSEWRRAKKAGIGITRWRNAWSGIYEKHVLLILDKYHDIFWSSLNRKLR